MRVTTASRFRPPPGVLVEWTAAPVAGFEEHPAPASMNQRFHLGATDPTWLAFSFRDPRVLDLDVLRAAFAAWIRRHETLRSRFRIEDGDIRRDVLPPDGFSLHRKDVGTFTASGELRDHVTGRFEQQCRPVGWPPYLMGAILGVHGTTVFGGFDHAHVDAHSIAIAVHEIQVLYHALSTGEPDGLSEVGSFVDRCSDEAREPADPADPAVGVWRDFLRESGGATPPFPLNLGVSPGQRALQRSETMPLLDASSADRLERWCRDRSGSVFTGLLAAFGLALSRSGASEKVRLVVPVHTRDDPKWTQAVGWFTTNMPIAFTVGDLDETGDAAVKAFREGLKTLRTELPSVLAALSEEFRQQRQDVFMLSYMDYRDFPVSTEFPECNPQHVSSEGECDDAQFWISRTDEGLFMRTRYPQTERAFAAMADFREHLGSALAEIAG